MIPSIEVENLTKKFGDFVADDAVSFSVAAGETYGLLGPNGAGKTTLIRMLTTLLPPTSGRARVQGHDVVSDKTAVRAAIGTVSQAVTTDENLTARENLSVQGKMYGLWGRPLASGIERRLKQVGLWERRDQIAGKLSIIARPEGAAIAFEVGVAAKEPVSIEDAQRRRAIVEVGSIEVTDDGPIDFKRASAEVGALVQHRACPAITHFRPSVWFRSCVLSRDHRRAGRQRDLRDFARR